ncbi:MAG: phospholipase D-like domain-containing protein [Candidatus Sericytochromatia bacterium]
MRKLGNIFSSLIALAFVVGCSSGNDINLNETASDISNISSVEDVGSDKSMPIIVSFNNDYKGLITENEPIARKDPRNSDKYFIKLINSARNTLDGAFYDIQDPEVVKAFIKAKKRGVNVRLVTDDANLMEKEDPTKPRQAIIDLKNAGIPIVDDKREKLMHNKFMIVDNSTIWTGSMNLTTSSMFHHNNNSIMIRSPQLAENFNAEFKRMYEKNQFGTNPHEIPYKDVNVSGISIRTFFSPGGGTMNAILDELKKAQKNIKFMAFSMTDKNILDIMVQKKQAGLNVQGVFDNCLIPQYSIFWGLKKGDVMSLRDGNQALMHHKVMIIDDETVVTGSFNFSKSADEGNNENALIIKSASIAKQYIGEYLRVRTAAFNNKDLPPYDHPACEKQESRNATKPTNPIKPGKEVFAE